MHFDMTQTVADVVLANSAFARVFEDLGIDYCCGGKKSLQAACKERGLSEQDVLAKLRDAGQTGTPSYIDPLSMTLTELADHIEQTHHVYLRAEMPRLAALMDKVLNAHGPNHPELNDLRHILIGLLEELSQHMMKEEMILFPAIRNAESGSGEPFHCGSIASPIAVMEMEHQNAGDALALFRQLTAGYTAPADACTSYKELYKRLHEFELDLHQHIHKENNILFPRAIAAECA